MPVINRLEFPALKADRPVDSPTVGSRVDFVEHLPVRLTVTLGAVEMPIGKLFALGVGDVVELDRDVDAPVDIEVNGKIVARGHLVAVGDRFGVKVSEVFSGST